MRQTKIYPNSFKAWVLAARPKTLTGAAVPVLISVSMAWHSFEGAFPSFPWIPAALCFLFAFCMQIDANFVNDYFDCLKGADGEDRLGPLRACSQGWITLPFMRAGIAFTTLVACLCGFPLIFYGGVDMVFIGLACVVFCFLYTLTFSRKGLGDVLVLLFFGVVPVCVPYYIICHACPWWVVVVSVACGLTVDTLLVLNNYRDREQDLKHGKVTLLGRMSRESGRKLYLWLGVVAVCLTMAVAINRVDRWYLVVVLLLYVALHLKTTKEMGREEGKALNKILGKTARNIFVYGLLTAVIFLWG